MSSHRSLSILGALAFILVACGGMSADTIADNDGAPPTKTPGAITGSSGVPATTGGPSLSACGTSLHAATDATLAAEFASAYHAFDLGAVPGVPDPLGGCVIAQTDPNTLLIAGRSEYQNGALYQVKVKRDACKHIVGWDGTATKIMDAPYIDANLVYGPSGALLYSMWNADDASFQWPAKIAQRALSATAPTILADIRALSGVTDEGPGGIGFVPPGLGSAGELRGISQPLGEVLHIAYTKDGTTGVRITSAQKTGTKLAGWPGGFAYVPAGSPGFPKQRMIVAEWKANVVSTYEVDDHGDPIVATRSLFFDHFNLPWGAYFDAVTGDYLFITWGGMPDHVISVQGFAVPPSAPK